MTTRHEKAWLVQYARDNMMRVARKIGFAQMTADELAKIIFDWFNSPSTSEDDGAPYTFNAEADDLNIGVDGYLDCRKLATAILAKSAKVTP